MENNKENKSKFFGQYYGQSVMTDGVIREIKVNHNWNIEHPSFYLELTPLYEISDEDKYGADFRFPNGIDAVKIVFNGFNWKAYTKIGSYFCGEGYLLPNNVDYLRSKGYAVDWMDLSVEDLINYGWIKLRTNEQIHK